MIIVAKIKVDLGKIHTILKRMDENDPLKRIVDIL